MSCRYHGDEPSPKGLGYCAHLETEGKRRKGRDGKMWVVKANVNGVLSWRRSNSAVAAISTTKKVTRRAVTTSGRKMKIKKPTNMKEAASIYAALKKDEREFEKAFENRSYPTKGAVFYFPARKYRLKAATSKSSTKGYLVGQGLYSNKYALVVNDHIGGGHWYVTKNSKDLYSYKGYLVTGSGADPAFAIL
jgi:hypothetical protein